MNLRSFILAGVVGTAIAGAMIVGVACSHGGESESGGGVSDATLPGNLSELEKDTGVKWTAVVDPRYGNTGYLFPRTVPPVTLTSGVRPSDAARAFFAKYGRVFQMVDPASELTPEDSHDSEELQFASFTQTEGAASVYGTRLSMVFDGKGHISHIIGAFVPNLHGFATTAALTPAEAASRAQADLTQDLPAGRRASLEATPSPVLTIYVSTSAPALAYSLVVSYALDDATATTARQRTAGLYGVDANTGAILSKNTSFPSQYKGSDVEELTGTGTGELGGFRLFPSLATRSDGGNLVEPYYLQVNAGDSNVPLFARYPWDAGVAVTSHDDNTWDTAATLPNTAQVQANPGSAVDAFFFLNETGVWWQQHGRDGWDNRGTPLGVMPHDSTPIAGAACNANAYWDCLSTIHVCPFQVGNFPGAFGATSVDFAIMAHEFQHAVNQGAFATTSSRWFGTSGEGGPINESLSDIFGEFVAHDVSGDANCVFGNTWIHGSGLRNMINPHKATYPGPQPDFYNGPDYNAATTDPHHNDGVANKAWSLLTFGGHDVSEPKRGVEPSLALGWANSELMYLNLVASRGLTPNPDFYELAWAMDAVASRTFGSESTQRIANACAWYAVGVFAEANLTNGLGMDLCDCTCDCDGTSHAETCDAGKKDARSDAHDAGPPIFTSASACNFGSDGGVECDESILRGFAEHAATFNSTTCPADAGGIVVPTCPTGNLFACCTTPGSTGSPLESIWNEQCYYDDYFQQLAADVGESVGQLQTETQSQCMVGGGIWTLSPWYPSDAGEPQDGGSDAGVHDAAHDSSKDAGDDGPPHC